MPGFLNRIANPFVKLILRTFLHRLISRSVMLITVTGRSSGQKYTTPVNYLRDGDAVTAISRKHRTWWRNLRGGAPVELRIKGKIVPGCAEVMMAGIGVTATELKNFYEQVSPIGISQEKARQLARDSVIVRIRLGGDRQVFP